MKNSLTIVKTHKHVYYLHGSKAKYNGKSVNKWKIGKEQRERERERDERNLPSSTEEAEAANGEGEREGDPKGRKNGLRCWLGEESLKSSPSTRSLKSPRGF